MFYVSTRAKIYDKYRYALNVYGGNGLLCKEEKKPDRNFHTGKPKTVKSRHHYKPMFMQLLLELGVSAREAMMFWVFIIALVFFGIRSIVRTLYRDKKQRAETARLQKEKEQSFT